MNREFTQAELEAFLDEALSPAEMSEVESQLRQQPELARRLEAIHDRRDAGVHTLGEIWRRHRVSCPDRETLGSYLLNVLDPDHHAYIEFHLQQIGCRLCLANVDDLRSCQAESEQSRVRQRRYFQSSAGYLQQRE